MKNLNTSLRHRNEEQTVQTPNSNRLTLTRMFVETGDERCPLAGIWSRLPELDAAIDSALQDDPGLPWPALRRLLAELLPRRAFHRYPAFHRNLISI